MQYNPKEIEAKWQKFWQENNIYQVENNSDKPKFYALDMFPYPSGKGLHIGHPLGYIATDIMARYKKMKGFNILHPMGFDSFGLPAEQYAVETGQHPAITTAQNIETFKNQLGKIGFNYDWSRTLQTSSPEFYKWTQWIFIQLFQSWYNTQTNKAEDIDDLIKIFEKDGNQSVKASCDEDTPSFTAQEWAEFAENKKQKLLLKYRLTYVADAMVNWCPALGMVLANDEVKDGLSERGGHPVERKKMRQWMMRISAYAERLLQGLETIDWSDAIKEQQRNWIGKSFGAEIDFKTENGNAIKVFTTRPDTIFGATFLVIAPEHELVKNLTSDAQENAVTTYVATAKNRSDLERQSDVKNITGVFTGTYAVNPFNNEKIPIWIADYVLVGYGTGAVMAVPEGDERDFRFASHFNLPIIPVKSTTLVNEEGKVIEADPSKEAKMINSEFLNGMSCKEAIQTIIKKSEELGVGKGKVNYRLRDVPFSRQRYWGEPVPMYFKDEVPHPVPVNELPLNLPEINEYKPTQTGEPPLGRAKDWKYKNEYQYELTTMPGWAGSSWYFLRYTDVSNLDTFADKNETDYWNQVDLYIGGSEHAVGHLLYSRFWTKVLYDKNLISFDEPFKKLINQGMIQGTSALVYRVINEEKPVFVSSDLKDKYEVQELHTDISFVENNILDTEKFKAWREEFKEATFIVSEDGKYYCNSRVEKMSKRWHNVVNPNDIVANYSADTLRLYEMFLGPLEQSKPWDPKNIDGSHRFLKKLWRLFFNENEEFSISNEVPTKEEQKVIHQTIKKVEEDLERFSFNTPVSEFMKCVNELNKLKCNKKDILENLLLIIAPYAVHIAEELWAKMGHVESIHLQSFPQWDEKYLKENDFNYPIMINGKKRTMIAFDNSTDKKEIECQVLKNETVLKWTEGKTPKKVIVVPNKIVNIVL